MLTSFDAGTSEFVYLGRSPEGLLMGDAYTAVADDENTLFYNPAALGRHYGISVNLISPVLEVTNYLKYKDKFENFPKDAAGVANRVMGLPLYMRVGAAPTLKMHHFGFTLFANSKTSLVLENAIHPTLDADFRLDRGFIVGYAYTINNVRGMSLTRPKSGPQTSFGVALKNINRQGLQGSFDLFGTEMLEIISNSDSFKDVRKNMGFAKGKAWGLDLGVEQTFYSKYTTVNFGASLMDVNHTSFKNVEGKARIPKQEMTLNLGSSFTQKFFLFEYTLAADIHPALEPIPFGSKMHFGLRVGFPFLKVYGGWNSGYVSYGVAVDVWLFRISAGFYGVEVGSGSDFKEREAERSIVTINLLRFNIDL